MKKLGALFLMSLSSVTAWAQVDCTQVNLPGVYQVESAKEGPTIIQISPVFAGIFRVSRGHLETQFDLRVAFKETKLGLWDRNGHPYSMVGFSVRKETCTLSWYNPEEADFEFNMILDQNVSGDLVLGGDFETYEVMRLKKITNLKSW